MGEWKRDLGSGLVVLVPLFVTIYAIGWLFLFIAGLPLVGVIGEPSVRVAVTLAVFVLAIAIVGMATRTAGGALASGWLDTVINRVPVLRVIYNASQLAVETAVSGDGELNEPVKVTTWMGARMTAFRTGKRTDDGRMVLFMPTAPNVTTGYVIEVDPEAVESTDETVEEAMTRLLSAGFGDRDRPSSELVGPPDD